MDNSAAAMIQRFRNAKPTSREDREKQKEASGINKLWYETGDQEEVERPRALVVGPAGQPSRPSSALRNAREPNDYMASPSNSLYQNRKLGASVGLDDMISNEIRQLQAQMEEQDRATNARMNLGSFDPTRSLDRSYEGGPTYRFNARDSRDSLPRRSASPSPMRRSSQQPRDNGLSDSTDEFLRKYQVGSFGADAWRDSIAAGGTGSGGGAYRGDISPLRLSGDIMRSSVETLGSTGIRGLLVPHLKLDGKKEEKPVVEEVVKSDAELAEMNRQLEELLKSMNANHPPRNEYFPEGVAESILQITNKVQADILDFKSLFGDKHQREDDEEKALKERDEKMKEEGRKQAREKQLLDLDLPASHPLEYFGVWDPAQQQHLPIMNNQRRLDYFPYHVSHATPQRPPQEPQHTPHPVSLSQAMVGTAQQQIDLSELRLSDDGSVGSPFPQYNSTILSPEASNNNTNNNKPKEGFAVGNASVASAAAGTTEPANPVPTTSAVAAAPTLASAGLLSGAAPVVASASAGSLVPVDRSQVRGFGPTAGLVQSALDSEIAAVDTAYHQIRALHHQLGNRMRHLDALHSSVSVPPGPAGPTRGPLPVTAYQRSAQTHFLREGYGPGGVQHGGIPLYARPGGPPPHPHHLPQHQPQYPQSGYPAGLGPMAVADNHYAAPVRAYSALEEYYNSLAEDQLAATQDTRTLFNPFPELVHSNILGVNKGIQAALDVTMRTLHARLPEEVVKRSPPAPAVHPTLAEATAAAAHTVLPAHSTPVIAPSVVPAATTTSSSAAPKPSAEPALSSVVNKVASSLVEGVLDVSEYRKSGEGLLTRSFPPPTAPVDAAHATTAPVASAPVAPVVAAVSSGATAAATGLKSYLDKVTEVAPAHATIPVTAPVATPSSAPVPVKPTETKAPSTGVTALATVAPGKSSREVLAELDSVLGVDDKKSNYLARDLFVPTSTANSFPAVSHAPPSAQEKPFLHAADAYLQSHYGRNTYDPRMQFDPPAQRSAQFGANKNNAPVVIQAPSDHELLHRHPQFASQGGSSAPPAAVEFAMARAQSQANPVSAPSRLYSQQASSSSGAVPSAHIAEVHQTNGYPAYPADPRRTVELANAQHLRRPVEGGAVNYLFENRIGVMATENGNKYVSPFVPAQEPTYAAGNAGYNPHYTNRQASPPARNKNDNFKNESKSSPPGYAASSAGKKIINLPSPTSIAAPHERQSYLAQMRQLRANLTGK